MLDDGLKFSAEISVFKPFQACCVCLNPSPPQGSTYLNTVPEFFAHFIDELEAKLGGMSKEFSFLSM